MLDHIEGSFIAASCDTWGANQFSTWVMMSRRNRNPCSGWLLRSSLELILYAIVWLMHYLRRRTGHVSILHLTLIQHCCARSVCDLLRSSRDRKWIILVNVFAWEQFPLYLDFLLGLKFRWNWWIGMNKLSLLLALVSRTQIQLQCVPSAVLRVNVTNDLNLLLVIL
jgi:hypothetical protein